MSSLFSL